MSLGRRPIVVCGAARSGTTTVAMLLTSHERILIGREVPLDRLPSLPTLIEETASYHREEWSDERRAEVVRLLWSAASRPVPLDKPNATRWE